MIFKYFRRRLGPKSYFCRFRLISVFAGAIALIYGRLVPVLLGPALFDIPWLIVNLRNVRIY